VEEQILAAPCVDKAETFVCESLDRAFCHLPNSSKSVLQGYPNPVFGLFHRKDAILSGGLTAIN
jgi:hypothetical protein